MTLPEEYRRCFVCGNLCDGSVCDGICLARAEEMDAERERRERDLTITAQTYKARQAVRKAQMANILGPRS